jgi:hypothetical protein
LSEFLTVWQGEAGRNPSEISNADKFDPRRKVENVSAFSYGQHECLAKDVALAFVTGLIKLVADLKELRPAPGQMGQVKTIRVGTEKAYLNDSWSYLGFDASSKFNYLYLLTWRGTDVKQPGRFISMVMAKVALRATGCQPNPPPCSSTTIFFRRARRKFLARLGSKTGT